MNKKPNLIIELHRKILSDNKLKDCYSWFSRYKYIILLDDLLDGRFNMGDEMSIISPKDRGFKINIDSKGKYYPLIKVIRYDRIGNMYSNKHYFANTGNESRDDVTQSEDALDYVDDI